MSFEVINPKTKEKLYKVEPPGARHLEGVFSTARQVQKAIASMTVKERLAEAAKISRYIIEHYGKIADRVVQETGKTHFEALSNELFEICDGIDYYRDHAAKILEEQKVHTPLVLMGKKSRIVYEPMGVVLVIAPWNYPLIQCFTPSILAFIAGNAVIFKPSEVTPLQGLYEEIMEGAGFMKDAIQIVYGDKETGAELIHQRPDKIHFTGSTRAGKQVMKTASEYLIPVDLELGGKDPAIVFDDVNIEKTANGIIWGAFTNAGQSCTSIERCYVHEALYEPFLNELVRITNGLSLTKGGNGDIEHCDIGAMTAEFQIKIVEGQIEDAVNKGAKILTGGKRVEGTMIFPPTVISEVTPEMEIAKDETFGPILPVMKFNSEEEAIEQANDTPYGLGASVWSSDLKRAHRVARAIRVGNVAINNHMLTEANPALPFGGLRDSGFGRYKGDWGLLTFSNIKSIISGPNDKNIEPHWYPFTAEKYDTFPKLMKAFFSRPRKWIQFAKVGLKLDNMGNKAKIK
jgi:acyl-CoA reductase-like NAD-dependent aldehyde dehydrogenase